MDTVGIEGGESNLRRIFRAQVEDHLAIKVSHDQLAAAMGRRQRDHQGREHAGDLFGIPVVDEEAAGVVDQKLVELGRHRIVDAKPKGRAGDQLGQRLLPLSTADPDSARFELPRFPDLAVDQRLLPPAVGCRLGGRDQPIGLRRQKRKRDPAHAIDVDRGHEDLPQSADAKVARPIDRPEAIEQGITNRRHDHSVPAVRRASSRRARLLRKLRGGSTRAGSIRPAACEALGCCPAPRGRGRTPREASAAAGASWRGIPRWAPGPRQVGHAW